MKYILSLFILLWSMMIWGQGEGFDPSNPQEPGQKYFLTVTVSPEGAGSTSPSGKNQYALGQKIDLHANANTNYRFVGWRQGTASVSDQPSFNYTIPAAHTQLTALFEYQPNNPSEPSPVPLQHKLLLNAFPAEGGHFNVGSGTIFKEGEIIHLQAYLNSGYEFEGWKQGEDIVSTEGSYSLTMGTEDISLTGMFRFNPSNPGNPGSNHWNAETGEVIIDDFKSGNIMSAIDGVIGGSGNRNKVTMVIVNGQMSSYDFGLSDYLTNCSLLDLSRTKGCIEIPSYAFDYTKLSSIILPASVEHIGDRAFADSPNLTDISCYAITPPTVGSGAFQGINEGLVLHVLSSSISLYSEAAGWKDLTILPLTEEVRTLGVHLPTGSEGIYKNMTLELVNTETGQKQRYVISDRVSYTFNGLLKNCRYHVFLKTPTGTVLGQVSDIEIKEENKSITFGSLLALLQVSLKVLTPDGTDVTNQTQITWLDTHQAYLSQGNLLKGQTAATLLNYRITLNQELGMHYVFPKDQTHTVQEKENQLAYTLLPIETCTVTGLVKDANGSALSGAVISISQKLNKKYSKSVTTQTDVKGKFELQVYDDESTISASAINCISQTWAKDTFEENTDLGTIVLKSVTGATISLSFTYTTNVAESEATQRQNGYSDYANVSYNLYNVTQNKAITEYSVQYPSIVLLEEVSEGDQVRIIATSKNNAFTPVESTAIIDAMNRATATFNLIELGEINASYASTSNTNVVAILYNSKEELVKKQTYSHTTLSLTNLPDGVYTLVSMAHSTFFNSILKLSQLAASGLVEGTDYVQNQVTVKSGLIAKIVNDNIPILDESKLYYTGSNTAFTVNKASIVAGNYLTLKGKIDFKSEYSGIVSNVQMIVDLPESCSFVENSIIIGSKISEYTLDGNRLTIPLSDYADQVRFCIIPTVGGTYSPNAFIEFALEDKTIQQPIGSAYYEVKDLTITVPSTTAQSCITVNGASPAHSKILLYDNNILIGETQAIANGLWFLECDLYNPNDYSLHSLYAKVTTPNGIEMITENKSLVYDQDYIETTKITMYNYYNTVELDLLNPKSDLIGYTFVPSQNDFTFKIDFNIKETAHIFSRVMLYVTTSDGQVTTVATNYDKKAKAWIGTNKFNSNNLPVNATAYPVKEEIDELKFDATLFNEYVKTASEFDLNDLFLEANKLDYEYSIRLEDVSNSFKDNGEGEYIRKFICKHKINLQEIALNNSFSCRSITMEEFEQNVTSCVPIKDTNHKIYYIRQIYENDRIGVEYFDKDELKYYSMFYYMDLGIPIIGTRSVVGDIATVIGIIGGLVGVGATIIGATLSVPVVTSLLLIGLATGVIGMMDAAIDNSLAKLLNGNADCLKSKKSNNPSYENLYEELKVYAEKAGAIGIVDAGAGTIMGLHSVISLADGKLFKGIGNSFGVLSIGFGFKSLYNSAKQNDIKGTIEKECNPNPNPQPEDSKMKPYIDPSGYVYEAVESNRLQGATATCYYKEMVEDMYGDLHENIVLWDAAEYAQKNPLFTDEHGMYAWDVPQGLWQVKFEKEGYQTTYSEWLPVPPPQLEVNIGMTQTVQPTVDAIRGYETGIEIDFSKFMQPSTTSAEQIKITRNGNAVTGEVIMLNEEVAPSNADQKFVSKVRFVPVEPLATTDKVVLTISRRVKSYAGIGMENDYSQEIDIIKEAKSIVASDMEVIYNKTADITVAVEPAEASAGKKMTVVSASPMIATITPAEVTLNEEGKATFTVTGELLGSTVLQFAVEGMDLKAEVKVNVVAAGLEDVSRSYQLSMGWNWLSVNVNDKNLNDVAALLEPIKESVVTIKGQNGELTNEESNGLQGSLTIWHPEQAYKIQMKQDATLDLKGKPILAAKSTITLNKGWNWMGYLPTEELSLESALPNLTAEKEDVIKGLDCFAIYTGTAWVGSLTHLTPGEGYMYYSQSVKSFNYAESEAEANAPYPPSQWEYNARQYADNMTLIARLYDREQPVQIDKYLIGAFVGNECRGVAVEKDGYIFLTIHGEQADEQVSLRAFDLTAEKEYTIKEEFHFSETMQGSYASPITLHLGELTGINSITKGLFIYPNPVRDRLYIRGNIDRLEAIYIVNSIGQTCILTDKLSVKEGIDVSSLPKGTYFMTIKSGKEILQQKFIKIE